MLIPIITTLKEIERSLTNVGKPDYEICILAPLAKIYYRVVYERNPKLTRPRHRARQYDHVKRFANWSYRNCVAQVDLLPELWE